MRASPVFLLLFALGCTGRAASLDPDTGIDVQVSLWPVDPVEIAGQPSRTRPAVDALVVVRDASGREVADDRTGADGSARFLLAPGSYVVSVEECPGAMSLPKENASVEVSAGAFVAARLACDTGIR